MQQEITVTDLATTNTELTPAGLQALGLQEQDIPQIKAVAALIQAENPLSVSQFGREVAGVRGAMEQ